jgi:hypothetical protein
MGATLYALALFALPVLTFVVLWKWGKWPQPVLAQTLFAVLITAVYGAVLVGSYAGPRLDDTQLRYTPPAWDFAAANVSLSYNWWQTYVPIACLLLCLLFLDRVFGWLPTIMVMIVIGCLLRFSFIHLTHHSSAYTIEPALVKPVMQERGEMVALVGSTMLDNKAERMTTSYPAGPLRTSALLDDLSTEKAAKRRALLQHAEKTEHGRIHVRPLWHTWLTGIYAYHEDPLILWYPGGPPAEGLKGLQLGPPM